MNFLKRVIDFFKDFNLTRFSFTGIVPESDLPKNDPQPVAERLGLNKKSPIGIKYKYLIPFPILIWLLSFVSGTVTNWIDIIASFGMLILPEPLNVFLRAFALGKIIVVILMLIAVSLFAIVFVKIVKSIK